MLLNFSAADVQEPARYATAYYPQHYQPLAEHDPEWDIFIASRDAFQLEVLEAQPMPKIYTIGGTILDMQTAVGDGTGSSDLVSDGPDTGQVWQVERVAFANLTTANSDVRLILNQDGQEFVIHREDNLPASFWTPVEKQITMSPDTSLKATFLQVGLGDNLRFAIYATILE
jgi:hypothetical protein